MGRVQPPSDKEVIKVKFDCNGLSQNDLLYLIQIVGIPQMPNHKTKVLLYKATSQIYGEYMNGAFHDSRVIIFNEFSFVNEYCMSESCLVKYKKPDQV